MNRRWDTIRIMAADKKRTIFWLDLIRVVSIFMVVAVHATSPLLNGWEDLSKADWIAGDIYASLVRACVPLLFMVSGYLLLGKQETISQFYSSRIKKVVVPFIAWSAIYLIWQNGYGNYTFVNAVKTILLSISLGPAYYHFWFLYALLLIYLFVPLLRIIIQFADNKLLWYGAVLWLVFSPIQDTVENLLGFEFAVKLGFFTEYIGFFYLGYLLGRRQYSRREISLALLTFIATVAYTAYYTYTATAAFGDYNDFYLHYLRLNIVLMSLSAFIWLKALGEKLSAAPQSLSVRLIQGLATTSFGIYLIHAMMLSFLRRGAFGFEISALSGPAVLYAPLVTVLAFAVSWAIVFILQKIPYLRAIVPG